MPTDTRPPAEAALLEALRAGDEAAFVALVGRHHASLRRVVRAYVASDAVADEVVQETWLAVVKSLDRFEARSTLKTWIFNIAINIAKTRGARERRTVPFSVLAAADEAGPSVPAERFMGPDAAWPSHWQVPPRPWEDPDRRLRSLEAREHLREAIAALPSVQQAVLTLRDVEGLGSDEVCSLLELTPGNQRVLLHRARSRVRASLETYMEG
jgi:RNA polymerase sigma-70 factor (ECF subfamily)